MQMPHKVVARRRQCDLPAHPAMVISRMCAHQPPTRGKTAVQTVRLRVLTTTDLHGNLARYDYIKDQPTQAGGLAGLSTLIAAARAEARAEGIASILLDNGDTLQGTPLASALAERPVGPDHPIAAAFNHLRYDAIGLGNHDLDHGMGYVRDVARALEMPVLNSNLRNIALEPLQHSTVLQLDTGEGAPLQVGLLSVLPDQSAAWNSHHLDAGATLEDPATAVRDGIAQLRAQGADLVIVLAHMGAGHADGENSAIQAAQAVARVAGCDALVLGHTHRRLPSPDFHLRAHVDAQAGAVAGVPALMAGHAGSDLGVMDLTLSRDAGRVWRVASHHCALRPNNATVAPDPAISALVRDTHHTVRTQLSTQVATIDRDLHSYFALVKPSSSQALMARAQHALVAPALADTAYAGLPLLAAAAAHSTGGRDGLANYVHIPNGPVLRRHIAGLQPFNNQTVALLIDGAGLRSWLEHSALLFNTLVPEMPDQLLVNPDVPAFQFDTIYGLTYRIDPSAPPYARISALCHQGAPVASDQRFVLATNHFRAAGGGGYTPTSTDRIIARITRPLESSMIACLTSQAPSTLPDSPPWAFTTTPQTCAVFMTHPDALQHLGCIAHLSPSHAGLSVEGFLRLSVTL